MRVPVVVVMSGGDSAQVHQSEHQQRQPQQQVQHPDGFEHEQAPLVQLHLWRCGETAAHSERDTSACNGHNSTHPKRLFQAAQHAGSELRDVCGLHLAVLMPQRNDGRYGRPVCVRLLPRRRGHFGRQRRRRRRPDAQHLHHPTPLGHAFRAGTRKRQQHRQVLNAGHDVHDHRQAVMGVVVREQLKQGRIEGHFERHGRVGCLVAFVGGAHDNCF